MNIRLVKMTKPLCREFQKNFEHDPMLFADMSRYRPFIYDEEACDAYVERYVALGRVHFAIMLGDKPIGELILKNIDYHNQCCELGICLQNDQYKNKGYGTQAEKLGLNFAFQDMQMKTVFADVIHKNLRSQHVLEKIGFVKTHTSDMFIHYRLDKEQWFFRSLSD